MAGPWTVNRDRRNGGPNGAGGAQLRTALGQVGSWSRRAVFTRPASPRRAPVRRGPGFRAGLAGRRRTVGTLTTLRAASLLTVMTIVAAGLAWATVSLAKRGIASSEAAVRFSAGPLVSPAPKHAGALPRRFGPISQEGAGPIVAELRQRFGAIGAGLIADARRAAAAATQRPVTAAPISALYAQPGHVDPVTTRPAWVMYLGLDATAKIGIPAEVVGRLMMGILGPTTQVGPWRVAPGHRGGSANCAPAWLARTEVSVCGWASDHAIGVFASPTRDTSVAELAMLMIKMRFDLQNP